MYSIMTLLWIAECYRNRRNAPVSSAGRLAMTRTTVLSSLAQKICYAVQIALHVKTISVTLKLWYYRELSLSGRHEPFLDTAQSLAESGTAAMLLGVALIGSLGWSLTREALSVRERRMIGFVFSVFGAIALAKSLCYSDESDAYRAFMLSEYVVHSILMLTVVVALNFTIAQLRLTLTDARWNSFATPLTYMKLNQFQCVARSWLLSSLCSIADYCDNGCVGDFATCFCSICSFRPAYSCSMCVGVATDPIDLTADICSVWC